MTTASNNSSLTGTLANTTATPNPNRDSSTANSKLASPALDESTTNGFNTAPATSEEDNLDYESEDDDDSRSNYSTGNNNSNSNNNNNSNISSLTNGSSRGGRQYSGRHSSLKGEETKRSHHNVLERKRRDLLKDSFTKLRDSVPTTQPKERVSRAEILKQAADFIQARVRQNANARLELDELIRKNQELEQRQKAGDSACLVGGSAAANCLNEPISKQES
jgi:hypothetical protein